MLKILEFLKPTTTFGKISFSLYIVGLMGYTALYIIAMKFPTGHIYLELIFSAIFWLMGVVGLIMYIFYLVKKRREDR